MSTPQKKERSPAFAAAIILLGAGLLFFAMPKIMLWLGEISPWLAAIFGTAAVSPVATNSPIITNALTLTASPTSLALNESSQLKAKYGTGSYSWPTNAAFGTITSSGDSAVYKRTSGAATDSATITVTSGSESKSVEIDFD